VTSNPTGRSLLAAVIVIALSAGVVAAGGPSGHAANGLATAAEKAGKTVPVAGQEANQEESEPEANEPEEEAPTDETSEDAGEHCATDPTTLDEAALAELNHGAIVCWAAHQETPAEFDNHGAWVSSWAKKNHGQEQSAGAREGHGKPENAGKP
jgi:hypothetical protein